MALQVVFVSIFIFSLFVCDGIEGRIISSSSTGKTILNAYGQTYDCVDFYKQPAFDHPLLKNHTFDHKMLATPFPDATLKNSTSANDLVNIELEEERCPFGTVPIRRDNKVDVSRVKVANGGVYIAGARTNQTSRYLGGGAYISCHNPKVTGNQYSATRVKLQNGPESMEAGLRVDPTLYGDSQTRIFVRTMADQKDCLNTLCGGFILVSSSAYLDKPIPRYSEPGIKYVGLLVFIHRNAQGDWDLLLGPNLLKIGFWPSAIFKGLKDVASYIEWAGEVYDPNPTPTAQMGAGKLAKGGRGFKNACFRRTSEYSDNDKLVDANDIEAFSDSDFYSSSHFFDRDDSIKREVMYGGPN